MSRTQTCLGVVGALDVRLKHTPIDRVKVTDLCRDAGISRATFYEYFSDVYNVAVWMWDHLMEPTLFQVGRTMGCLEANVAKLEALLPYRDFFARAARAGGAPAGCATVCQHEIQTMLERYTCLLSEKTERPLTRENHLELEFYVVGSANMTEQWLRCPNATPPTALARAFACALPAFMREALGA